MSARAGALAFGGVAVVAVVAATAAVRLLRGRFVVATVQGSSMRPTLEHGDRLVVRRTGVERLRRGDIVVLRPPPRRDPLLVVEGLAAGRPGEPPWNIKRVAALPGDPVPAEVRPVVGGAAVVPAGSLVVLGDNRAASSDSRHGGFFPADQVLGVVERSLQRSRPVRVSAKRAGGRPAVPGPGGQPPGETGRR